MEDSIQCSFCLDQIGSRNATIYEDDKKAYQNIFECSKTHLKGEVMGGDAFDWTSKSGGLLSPFCTNCFKCAQEIYKLSQEMAKLEKCLNILVQKFRNDIKQRVSKKKSIDYPDEYVNLKVDFIPDEAYDESHKVHSEEVDFTSAELFCAIGVPLKEDIECVGALNGIKEEIFSISDEVDIEFPEYVLGDISQEIEVKLSGEDFQEFQESKFLNNEGSNVPNTHQWPKLVLERLRFDKNGAIISPDVERPNNRCVLSKRKEAIVSSAKLQNSAQSLEWSDFYADNVPPIKRFQKERQFNCSLCVKCFQTKKRLRVHFLNVHDTKEDKCKICDKIFKNRCALRHHMSTVHISRRHVCQKCGMAFKIRRGLLRHIDIVHKKILKFQCQTCGKSFGFSDNMKKHQRRKNH